MRALRLPGDRAARHRRRRLPADVFALPRGGGTARGAAGGRGGGALDRARRRLPRRQRERRARTAASGARSTAPPRGVFEAEERLWTSLARADGRGRWPRATRSCARPGGSSGALGGEEIAGAGAEPARAGRRGRAARRADARARSGARQAPAARLRRAGPAQPPGDERLLAPLRARASAGASPSRSAWVVLGGEDGVEAVQFGGPTLRVLADGALRRDPALARLGPDILAPELRPRPTRSACCARRPIASSATPCSTRARSPASATSSRARPASRRASTPGGRSASSTDEELERVLRAARRADARRRSRPAPAPRRLPARRPALPALRHARSARAARATTTAPPTGARAARRDEAVCLPSPADRRG